MDAGTDVDERLARAGQLRLRGNAAAAARLVRALVAEDPFSVQLRTVLGDAEYQAGRYEAALEAYADVLEETAALPAAPD